MKKTINPPEKKVEVKTRHLKGYSRIKKEIVRKENKYAKVSCARV